MSLLTPAELAAHLRASERTVARMVAEGCPSILVGRRRRFALADVLAWTEQQAACLPDKTKPAAGTLKPASTAADFTASYRQAALRVMPSASNPN